MKALVFFSNCFYNFFSILARTHIKCRSNGNISFLLTTDYIKKIVPTTNLKQTKIKNEPIQSVRSIVIYVWSINIFLLCYLAAYPEIIGKDVWLFLSVTTYDKIMIIILQKEWFMNAFLYMFITSLNNSFCKKLFFLYTKCNV